MKIFERKTQRLAGGKDHLLKCGISAPGLVDEKSLKVPICLNDCLASKISTHTNYGRKNLEQVRLFEKLGANLNHVVLSHVDRAKDGRFSIPGLKSNMTVLFVGSKERLIGHSNYWKITTRVSQSDYLRHGYGQK